MADSGTPEPTCTLPEDFEPGSKFISVDPGYPCCVDRPNQNVARGASVLWRSLNGEEFEIRFPHGAPCRNWSDDWKPSKKGKLVCAIPEELTPGGYKYDVKIGDCECDPIVWVEY